MFIASLLRLVSYVLGLIKALWPRRKSTVESVNYHFLRDCNYACKFCFHTNTNRIIAHLEDAKEAFRQLKASGMKKINFSGGEPFLQKELLGAFVKFCKKDLHLESVSIVSNGSQITKDWLDTYGRYVDILAVSCDSFNEETNKKIGRGRGKHVTSVQQVARWCHSANIMFKLNTTVCKYNCDEDMINEINALAPARWKVFQVSFPQNLETIVLIKN